jgi:hypothetical protein
MVQRFKKKKLNTLFVNGFSLLCCFGLIIRLSLEAFICSVLALVWSYAQFCHYFGRSCYGETKRPGSARIRPMTLVLGWVQILQVGPCTLPHRTELHRTHTPLLCDHLRRRGHPACPPTPPPPHLTPPALSPPAPLPPSCDATGGALVSPVRPPPARRNG